jgi:hypothetical protein
VIGDCAVVVIGDGEQRTPDDPCYLLKQGGAWKVLPELARWQDDSFELTEEQKRAFESLEKQYEEEQKRLRERGKGRPQGK